MIKSIEELENEIRVLNMNAKSQERYILDLHAKIQYLVDQYSYVVKLEDNVFSFPDGDYWLTTKEQNKMDKLSKN